MMEYSGTMRLGAITSTDVHIITMTATGTLKLGDFIKLKAEDNTSVAEKATAVADAIYGGVVAVLDDNLVNIVIRGQFLGTAVTGGIFANAKVGETLTGKACCCSPLILRKLKVADGEDKEVDAIEVRF